LGLVLHKKRDARGLERHQDNLSEAEWNKLTRGKTKREKKDAREGKKGAGRETVLWDGERRR